MSVIKLEYNSKEYDYLLAAFREISGVKDLNPFDFNYTRKDVEIYELLSEVYSKSCSILSGAGLPTTKLVVMKGDDGQDGHAITLGEEVYTFINLTAYSKHLERKGFDLIAHLIHEMLHGAHYTINADFCPIKTFKKSNPILTHSLVEGIATYVSNKLYPEGENYWFGFLKDDDLKSWIKNCEGYYKNDISSLGDESYSDEQKVNLLSLKSFTPEDMVQGRRAYFCISNCFNDHGIAIEKLLRMSFNELSRLLV